MKYIGLLVLFLSFSNAFGEEFLFENTPSGIVIHEIDGVGSIDSKVFGGGAEAIRFNSDNDSYFVTGLIHPHKANVEYPKHKKIADIAFQQAKNRYPDMVVVNQSTTNTKFKNKTVQGSFIEANYTGSSMMLCDITEVHPVGNKHYLTITLTTAFDMCEKHIDKLRGALKKVYSSTVLNSFNKKLKGDAEKGAL